MSLPSATLATSERDGIRLLTIRNPPVNALGHELRVVLIAALDEAGADPAIRGVVLTGEAGFLSGADIRELDAPESPRVFDLTAKIEAMAKPVIAAVDGMALGGGLEVALACHGRVASGTSRFGFPEVRLGLLPGAGGTQYAPRLTGVALALDLIASGRMLRASEALAAGLVDRVVEDSPIEAACNMALDLAGTADLALPRVRDRASPVMPEEFETALAAAIAAAPRSDAVRAITEALRAATTLPVVEGLERERALFESLRISDESRALRHQFFATRAAARIPGLPENAAPIGRIGVIGGGTMGRGIALAALAGGLGVDLVEPDAGVARAADAQIRETLRRDLDRGRISTAIFEKRLSALAVTTGDARALPAVDLVIEAAIEDMGVKQAIFAALDQMQPVPTLLASNTSSLDIDRIAGATGRPAQVLGLHFFSPANVMKLLEIVRGTETSPEAIARALALAKTLGKVPVVVGNCDGFVGNRMLAQRHIAAERLLLDGALPEEVDAVWRDFGFPMGVFAMTDLAGVDVNWRVRQARGTALAIHDAIYALGRHGQKTGAGFFRYAPGSRKPESDPEITALILAESARAGIARRSIPSAEILERLLYPMINEGARLLDEGIARSAGDIDVVWTNGYGWPAWRGGPMYHADREGLGSVAAALGRMALDSGNAALNPAPLLLQLAERGARFADLPAQDMAR